MKGLELKYGNHKLGESIAIFNMGTAKECPSKQLGLCSVINSGIKCYAMKAEEQYPNTVPAARKRQELYWKKATSDEIIEYLFKKIDNRRKKTKYLRVNESGDFWNQDDIAKLSTIASMLQIKNIVTYTYSARSDLDFSNVSFLIKGSNHDKGNNGKAVVIAKNEPVPKGYVECPGSCGKCIMCMSNKKINIAFRKH